MTCSSGTFNYFFFPNWQSAPLLEIFLTRSWLNISVCYFFLSLSSVAVAWYWIYLPVILSPYFNLQVISEPYIVFWQQTQLILEIFYFSLPSSLSCRTFTFISGFGRKVSSFRFVGHFALGYICFLPSFRETWFLFLGEALAFPRPAACPSQWSLAYPWLDLEAVDFPAFSIPAATHTAFSVYAHRCMASGL